MIQFEPVTVALLAGVAVLYARAVRRLGRRGYLVPRGQQAFWYAGVASLAFALLGPLDGLADEVLWAHMAQHLVLGDLAAPLMLIGLRTPVLLFLLPRTALVRAARWTALRRLFRTLRHPLVALPIYVVVLYGWHLAPAFDGALRSPVLHALQHESFFAANLLVWWCVIEPKRRRLPGELWKIGYLLATRMVSMFLGMAILFTKHPIYGDFYGDSARAHGLSPIADQQLAGGMMMTVDIVVMFSVLTLFFWRAAADHDRGEDRRQTAATAT